jgi:hypothetical protein
MFNLNTLSFYFYELDLLFNIMRLMRCEDEYDSVKNAFQKGYTGGRLLFFIFIHYEQAFVGIIMILLDIFKLMPTNTSD